MVRLRVRDAMPAMIEDIRYHGDEQVAAWREAHHAAQAVVEVGKSWGEVQKDDSHSAMAFGWHEGGFVSDAGKGFRARLMFHNGLEILMERGEISIQETARLVVAGRTLEEITAWVRSTAERWGGEPEQDSIPAPDLPDHPVRSGKRFAGNHENLGCIWDQYNVTASVLARVISRVRQGNSGISVDAPGPRLWPHHFDLASLFTVASDSDGAMTKTIGIGITPPDEVESSGYWYVSPWSPLHAGRAFVSPALSAGRWYERDGMPMAVLAVADLERMWRAEFDSVPQSVMLAEFVSSAFNACMDHFEKGDSNG